MILESHFLLMVEPLRPRSRTRIAGVVAGALLAGLWGCGAAERESTAAHATWFAAADSVLQTTPFGDRAATIEDPADFARFHLAGDPAEAHDILEDHGAGYVVVAPLSPAELAFFAGLIELPTQDIVDPDRSVIREGLAFYRLMNTRLLLFDGGDAVFITGERDTGGGIGRRLPAVTYLRLIYESPATQSVGQIEVAACKLFEVTESAVLSGSAPPQTVVTASLELVTNTGRAFRYSSVTRADDSGAWRLRWPYATEPVTDSGVRATGDAQVRIGDQAYRRKITEEDVQQGRLVTVDGEPP